MLLEVQNAKKHFIQGKHIVHALDGANIFIRDKTVTALVGESGCGKTTLARVILGFCVLDSGTMLFKGEAMCRKLRRKPSRGGIQIVFQNPFMSFDPRYTVFSTLQEVLDVFKPRPAVPARAIIRQYLEMVGLEASCLESYPHQLSGGQLQRLSLARSLLCDPDLIVLDEPTSSLDISSSARIVKLLGKLQEDRGIGYLFISHDLKLVKKIAHYVFVMYRGKIIEHGLRDHIYRNPVHPYTQILIAASDYRLDRFYPRHQDLSGCVFRDRCLIQKALCADAPPMREIETGHFVSCHLIS